MIEVDRRPIFPEAKKLDKNGDLEKYLISLSNGSLIEYSKLPQNIRSTGIEKYANWFTDTVASSTGFNELGAYIHVRKNSSELVIPSKPETGTYCVAPPFSRKRDIITPVALIHSHPDICCFSQPPMGDLNAFMNGYGEKDGKIKVPVWILATPIDNFLLLKTDETVEKNDSELDNKDSFPFSGDFFSRFRRYGVPTAKSLEKIEFFELLEKAEEMFFGGKGELFTIVESYYGTAVIAETCNLGFYHSLKDGNYKRVTKESIRALLEIRYEEALQKALLSSTDSK